MPYPGGVGGPAARPIPFLSHLRLASVGTNQRHHWRSTMASAYVNGVAGKSWATNKSASARSTAVAFYPRVTRGVIYISAEKAVVYRI